MEKVEQVKVDRYTTFSTSSSYPEDVKIVVTYHTFPVKESEEIIEDSEKTEETISTVETQEDVTETDTEVEETVLTVENSKDLAALLEVKDSSDPFVNEFAKEYEGRIIEFDGNITHMMNHENYNTRYDILIYGL